MYAKVYRLSLELEFSQIFNFLDVPFRLFFVPVITILLFSVAPLRLARGDGSGPERVQEAAPCTSNSVLSPALHPPVTK